MKIRHFVHHDPFDKHARSRRMTQHFLARAPLTSLSQNSRRAMMRMIRGLRPSSGPLKSNQSKISTPKISALHTKGCRYNTFVNRIQQHVRLVTNKKNISPIYDIKLLKTLSSDRLWLLKYYRQQKSSHLFYVVRYTLRWRLSRDRTENASKAKKRIIEDRHMLFRNWGLI